MPTPCADPPVVLSSSFLHSGLLRLRMVYATLLYPENFVPERVPSGVNFLSGGYLAEITRCRIEPKA